MEKERILLISHSCSSHRCKEAPVNTEGYERF